MKKNILLFITVFSVSSLLAQQNTIAFIEEDTRKSAAVKDLEISLKPYKN